VSPMRIAYAARASSANGFYRGIGPMTALAQVCGHQVQRLPVEDNQPTKDAALREVDVLHIHRFCEERTLRLARAAKASGAAVVWDNDDDHGTMPRGVAYSREWTGFAWERRLAEMRRLFRFTDLVTTPSELLAERLRELGAPLVEVIENYVADHFARTARPQREGVTIGWVAGLEHAMDAERLPIRDVLQQLLDERPEVAVASIGLRLGLRSDRYHHIGSVPLHDLPDYLSQFHIGIAPLADLAFNRARSNIKVKEYTAVGVPWLASPVGPYVGLGEKQGGRLVGDGEWHSALIGLIERPRARSKLAKRAAKWAAGETLAKNARIWEARFAAAIERAATSSE
jgi:glycosyltransferase involved in cell wall biosynthesis